MSSVGYGGGPRDWSPPQQTGPRRRVFVGLALAAIVAVVLGVRLAAGTTPDRPPILALSTSAIAPSGSPIPTDEDQVNGLTPGTDVGSCFSLQHRDVRYQSCGTRHAYQLVAIERASGDDNTYPTDDYWHGPVAHRCYLDLRAWSGRARDEWPTGLTSADFIPVRTGWAAGDRTVYCVAEWTPSQVGSSRNLPPRQGSAIPPDPTSTHPTSTPQTSAPLTIPSPTYIAPSEQTVSGDLYVLTSGTQVCLGIRGSDYTGPVESITADYTWQAYVDGDNNPEPGRSGIALGSTDGTGAVHWHAGQHVTLRGSIVDDPATLCSSARAFDFTAVSS